MPNSRWGLDMIDGEGAVAQSVTDTGITRALTQTRDLTSIEKREVLRTASRMRPRIHRGSIHRMLSSFAAFGLAFAAFAVINFVIDAIRAGVGFSQKGLFGFVVGAGAVIAVAVRRSTVTNTLNRFRTGDRYVLGETGFAATIQSVSSFYPWHCIRDLHISDRHVAFHISGADVVVLLKPVFGNQDVAGFCVELEKLWRQSNASVLPRNVSPTPSHEVDQITQLPPGFVEEVLKLRQARELTPQERRDFMRLIRKHASRRKTNKWFTAYGALWWIAMAWFALSVFAAVQDLRPGAPDLALQLAVTSIISWALLFGIGHVSDFFHAKRLRRRDTGNVFLIEPDGLRVASPFEEIKGFWHAIPKIVESDTYLFVMLSESIGSIMVKSAFAGQDVPAFCQEVQRRWKAAQEHPIDTPLA